MSFPEDNQPILTELKVGAVDWANITSDVRQTSPIVITRGRSNGASGAEASSCNFLLNNRLGRYSPRNPHSPLFGLVGRNTPVRVSIGRGAYGMVLAGGNGRAESADSAALSPAGDIDLRVDLEVLDGDDPANAWTTGYFDIATKFRDLDTSRSYAFILINGRLQLSWSPLGTAASMLVATATTALTGSTTGRRGVRATLDVNNGGGGWTVRFYEADDLYGVWTPVGAAVSAAGVTSIFNGDGITRIGANPDTSTWTAGRAPLATVYGAQIISNAVGVAEPIFELQPLDPVPFALSQFIDGYGNSWLFNGSADAARIWYGDVDVRFHGEIAELPPRWDTSGSDSYVPVRAAGLLRRIGQGSQPINSGLQQFLLSTDPITYWPLNDGTTSRRATSASGTYRADLVSYNNKGVYEFGAGVLTDYLPQALRINDLEPAAGIDYLQGYCLGSDSSPDALAWEFVYRADPTITGDGSNPSSWTFRATVHGTTAGTFDRWEMQFRPDGTNDDIRLVLTLDPLGETPTVVNLADSAVLAELTDGQLHHVRMQVTVNGANVDYAVYVDGVSVISGTRATYTLRGNWDISLFYNRLVGEDLLALGHLIVWENTANIPDIADTALAAFGFSGEPAGRRLERLCDELDVAFVGVGDLDDTLAMGLQYTDYFSNQLSEIEGTDFGIVYEPRAEIALAYRTRSSLYNQDPVVTVDLSANELVDPFEPVDDDQLLRNDIFAQRRDGGSYRATLESGPLSVLEPPNGASRYKDEVQVNVESDDMLPEVAGWLRHLGTIDEARYPHLVIKRESPSVVANPTLSAAVMAADVGDVAVITNASNRNIYDDISLLIVGVTETLMPRQHEFDFNCIPGSPYSVLELDDADVRVDPGDDSTLTSSITSSATSISVTSINGTLWTSAAGDMPIAILVGGEEMSVTAVSGASSPQTFTVTRSVNGVSKTHSAGAQVRLKRPATLAL